MKDTEKGPMTVSHLIIGAGPCGLYLGQKLSERKMDFLIVEKSRGVGGRVATRRIDNEIADHGAPYLKFSSQLLDLMLDLEIPGLKIDAKGIFNDGGMTTLFKKMSSSLPISKNVKIVKLARQIDHWFAESDSGEIFHAKSVILTAPLPQALELLDNNHIDYKNEKELKTVTYAKAVIGLFASEKDVVVKEVLPRPVHSVITMSERGRSGKVSVIRLNENYSESVFQQQDTELLLSLEDFFISSCEAVGKITNRELKKWKYTQPLTSLSYPYLEAAPQLYLAGDAFLYPDIRGALLSAEALAQKLI